MKFKCIHTTKWHAKISTTFCNFAREISPSAVKPCLFLQKFVALRRNFGKRCPALWELCSVFDKCEIKPDCLKYWTRCFTSLIKLQMGHPTSSKTSCMARLRLWQKQLIHSMLDNAATMLAPMKLAMTFIIPDRIFSAVFLSWSSQVSLPKNEILINKDVRKDRCV